MIRDPRWLEVSVACPECHGEVQVWSATRQPAEDDEGVWLSAGDTWRCDDGHVGSVAVTGRGVAHLGAAAVGTTVSVDEVEARYARLPDALGVGQLAQGSRP